LSIYELHFKLFFAKIIRFKNKKILPKLQKFLTLLLMIPLCAVLFNGVVEASEGGSSMTVADHQTNIDNYDKAIEDIDLEVAAKKKEISELGSWNTADKTKKTGELADLEELKKKLEAERAEHVAKKDALEAENQLALANLGYDECVKTPNLACVKKNLEELNALFLTSQIQLDDCKKAQALAIKINKISCDPLLEVVNKIGAKTNNLRVILQSFKAVDARKILSITGQNPFTDAKEFLGKVIDLLVKMVGLVALVFLVIGGFRLVAAAGNDNEIQKAKTMITYSIIGLVFTLLAYLIVAFVQGILYR
jgi:hypothetical protein